VLGPLVMVLQRNWLMIWETWDFSSLKWTVSCGWSWCYVDFKSCKGSKQDCGDHHDHLCAWVDDTLFASKNPVWLTEELKNKCTHVLKGVQQGLPCAVLGVTPRGLTKTSMSSAFWPWDLLLVLEDAKRTMKDCLDSNHPRKWVLLESHTEHVCIPIEFLRMMCWRTPESATQNLKTPERSMTPAAQQQATLTFQSKLIFDASMLRSLPPTFAIKCPQCERLGNQMQLSHISAAFPAAFLHMKLQPIWEEFGRQWSTLWLDPKWIPTVDSASNDRRHG